ncbi:MAG: hypothetical protein ABIR30_13400 [Chitinophagaceae bacterium]
MKKIFTILFILVVAIAISSCRDASTKADHSDTLEKNMSGDTGMEKEKEKITENTAPAAGTSRDSNIIRNTDGSAILANIDKYLLTKAVYPAPGSNGGIVNGIISIENTLVNTTFQKVMIEISILLADGKEYRTDYYTVINLDPGMKKTVKIPNTTLGNSVVSHVVKVKSNELTNGELILVGTHYTPQ